MDKVKVKKQGNKYYCKKRKFHGNRFTKNKPSTITSDSTIPSVTEVCSANNIIEDIVIDPIDNNLNSIPTSSSFQKLNDSINVSSPKFPKISGYRLIDVGTIISFIQSFPCSFCEQITTYSVREELSGISSILYFKCIKCRDEIEFKTCTENVNLRLQLAMSSIGCHQEKTKRFLGNMDMPPPVSAPIFTKYKDRIHIATNEVAKECMSQAALELKEAQGSNVTVSCDGTWQRRGFVSKNGVATVLSVNSNKGPSKVVDTHVSSNYCDKCSKAKKRFPDNSDYQEWFKNHSGAGECESNHQGTSGQMEPKGILKIFRRSEDMHGLTYTGYLGDGDSKSFKSVAEAIPPVYKGVSILKLECCGHVQKRMGKRLIDKVNEHKGKPFEDNVNDKDLEAANKNCLPPFVMEIIKPIFEELSSDALLAKCVHGGTQNANEAFHNLIWYRCPKTTFVGRKRLEIAVYDATIVYNNGELKRGDIFKNLGLNFGKYCFQAFSRIDKKRVSSSLIQNLDK
ncbi:unnamed protein product, partial [Trichobilharzia regenti]